ncbi:hypothetical protein LEMLEM_LOCUS4336 [Lemmus lemmus]
MTAWQLAALSSGAACSPSVETISRRSARPGPDAPQRRRAGGGTGRGERRGRREDAAPADARSGPMPRRPLHPRRPHPRPPPTARPGLERPQRGPERCPLGARETLSAALKAAAAPRRAWPGSNCRPKEKLLMVDLRIKSATYVSSCHCAADILSSFFSIV